MAITTTCEPKHKLFPEGLDNSDYEGWENWNYRRWAWEFLRRNTEFWKACDSLPKSKEARIAQKRAIRDQFGLRRFKHYSEAYDEGKPAQFRAIAVSPRITHGSSTWSRQLRNDEVCIVFKLRPSLFSSSALKLQLEKAGNIVERRANDLRKELGISRKPKTVTQKHPSLLRKLKLLDARNRGTPLNVIAEKLQTRTGVDLLYLSDSERKAYEQAVDMAQHGYLALLTSKSTRGSLLSKGKKGT
ncbi:transcriptional regulator domain-containing protein [Burkholderia thailandensis]|uniref:transcriptional regulator domain-containing protein n=1 Tax=Burkholderia thailandensis TaxID=57975 RepID=UPI003F8DD6A6